jgi:hypothetical protein
MKVELIEVAPGRYRVKRDTPQNFARSEHPVPYVISDTMDPVEQVDGKFYTSKSAFRAVGKANGLIEIGNEKQKPRTRLEQTPLEKERRRNSIKKAIEKFRSGQRA